MISMTLMQRFLMETANEIPRYPIVIVNHGRPYRKRLFDIHGKLLTNLDGSPANIMQSSMKDLVVSQAIRIVRVMYGDFYYFITREEDKEQFIYERQHGAVRERKRYHIYTDYEFDGSFFDSNIRILRSFHKSHSQ